MAGGNRDFAQFALSGSLLRALDDGGYEMPSPLQAGCIPQLLAGHDLLVEAPSGTGKTMAFGLPLLQRLDLDRHLPQALVLTPNYAVAAHIAEILQACATHLPGFHVLPIRGGEGLSVQMRQMHRGVHAVIGSPRWIIDHLGSGTLDLSSVHMLVFDELDEMINMGLGEDLDTIEERIPAPRVTAIFAGMLNEPVRRSARRYLRNPREIRAAAPSLTRPNMRQRYWEVAGERKLDTLTRLIEVEKNLDALVVFVHTRTAARHLAVQLSARGYAATAVDGNTSLPLFRHIAERLQDRQVDVIVATDHAPQGMPIPRLTHVIHYDMPCDTESYLRRIAQLGPGGSTILMLMPHETSMLHALERDLQQHIEVLTLPDRHREH